MFFPTSELRTAFLAMATWRFGELQSCWLIGMFSSERSNDAEKFEKMNAISTDRTGREKRTGFQGGSRTLRGNCASISQGGVLVFEIAARTAPPAARDDAPDASRTNSQDRSPKPAEALQERQLPAGPKLRRVPSNLWKRRCEAGRGTVGEPNYFLSAHSKNKHSSSFDSASGACILRLVIPTRFSAPSSLFTATR